MKGSGDGAPMLGADVLRRSVVPEYLLKNVTLGEAGCLCIAVPPYSGREAAPLDPEQISREGGLGTCVDVAQLGGRLTHFVTAVYLEVLGREPDPAGLRAWTEFVEASCSTSRGFVGLAAGFIESAEFRTGRALTLPDLAAAFYRAFLGREPTTTELESWLDALRTARRQGAAIIVGSPEFSALVPLTADAVAGLGRRLYLQLLQRQPSESELSALVASVLSAGDAQEAVAAVIVSPEFERRALSTRDYVTVLYRALGPRSRSGGSRRAGEPLERAIVRDGRRRRDRFRGVSGAAAAALPGLSRAAPGSVCCGGRPPSLHPIPHPRTEEAMPDKTYKIIELVGVSEDSIQQAIRNAVIRACESLKGLDWFEMTGVRGLVKDGKVNQFQVSVKVGFRIMSEGEIRGA